MDIMIKLFVIIIFVFLQGINTYLIRNKSIKKKALAIVIVAMLPFFIELLHYFLFRRYLFFPGIGKMLLSGILVMEPLVLWGLLKIWRWFFDKSDDVSLQNMDVQISQSLNESQLSDRIRSLDKQAQQKIAQIQKEKEEQLFALNQELEQLQRELNSI